MNKILLFLTIGRIFQMFIMFISFRVMTTYLPKEETGFYYFLISITSYFGLCIINPVGTYVNRKIHSWENQKNIANIFLLLNIFILVCVLFSFLSILVIKHFSNYQNVNWGLVSLLVSIFIYSTTWNNTIIPCLNLLNYRISFVLLSGGTNALSLASSYFLINHFSKNAIYWLFGQTFGLFIFFIIGLIYFFYKIQNKLNYQKIVSFINIKSIKEVSKFTIPVAATNISFWILTQSYRPLIEKFVGLKFLAEIGVGIGVAASISVAFEYLLQQLYLPTFYKNINSYNLQQRELSWNLLINRLTPLYFNLVIFLSISGPFILRILVDKKYWNSAYFVIIGAWIEFFRMNSNLLTLATHAEFKTKKSVKSYFIGGVFAFSSLLIVLQTTYYRTLTPLIILTSSIIVFVLLRREVKTIFQIRFNFKSIYFILIGSCIYPLIYIIKYDIHKMLYNIILFGIFGLYFTFIEYKVFQKGESLVTI